jgi:hypothetical protein
MSDFGTETMAAGLSEVCMTVMNGVHLAGRKLKHRGVASLTGEQPPGKAQGENEYIV